MGQVKDVRTANPQAVGKPGKQTLFETPRFFLDVHVLARGQVQKAHRHGGEDKCWYVLSGRGVMTLGGQAVPVGPGEAVWSPAGEDHEVRNDGPDDLRLLVFMAPHPKPPAP